MHLDVYAMDVLDITAICVTAIFFLNGNFHFAVVQVSMCIYSGCDDVIDLGWSV